MVEPNIGDSVLDVILSSRKSVSYVSTLAPLGNYDHNIVPSSTTSPFQKTSAPAQPNFLLADFSSISSELSTVNWYPLSFNHSSVGKEYGRFF